MPPTVCTVTPAHNASGTLARTLDSLLAQRLTDWRGVIVDDGSTDGTGDLAESYARADGRFVVLRTERRGLVGARNACLERAIGRYLCLLDADDVLAPDGLERLVSAAEERARRTGRPSGAYGAFDLIDPADRRLGTYYPAHGDVGVAEHFRGLFFVPMCHVVPLEDALAERFSVETPLYEDLDLYLRLAARGVVWAEAGGGPVGGYRCGLASLSRDMALMLDSARAMQRRAFDLLRRTPERWPELDLSPAAERGRLADVTLFWAARLAITGEGSAEAAALVGQREPHVRADARTIRRVVLRAFRAEIDRGGFRTGVQVRAGRRRVGVFVRSLVSLGLMSRGEGRRCLASLWAKTGGPWALLHPIQSTWRWTST
ncbi:MAG: glycosyltransferase family 2 protein [Phycisphaerae bacterium]|nr:glycosyltransferase family 2 protein [Phycisphaerae bacterium]